MDQGEVNARAGSTGPKPYPFGDTGVELQLGLQDGVHIGQLAKL